MKHMTRRAIQLIAFALMLPFWPVGDADAVFESALRGDYNLSLRRSCTGALSPIDPSTFIASPSGGIPQTDIIIKGTLTYNGSGGGSFIGEALSNRGGGATTPLVTRSTENCSVTYTTNSDGTFQHSANCNLSFTLGDVGGATTATLNGVVLDGQISLDGTVLTFGDTTPNVEIFTPNVGSPNYSVCTSTGTATARR